MEIRRIEQTEAEAVTDLWDEAGRSVPTAARSRSAAAATSPPCSCSPRRATAPPASSTTA